MARPQKIGLDYFPLDVDIDQDDKVAIIEAQHGILGFAIIIKLLMKIYSEGYYYDWTEKEQILFSRRVNVDINQVDVIIKDSIKWGMFDKELFNEHKILSSVGIQVRYLEAVKRRNKVEIAKEFLLLSDEIVNANKNISIVTINDDINEQVGGINVYINPQSILKNSKEYKSILNKTTTVDKGAGSSSSSKDTGLDENISKVSLAFQDNGFGTINITVKEMILELLELYSSEWILEAMKVAVEANKRSLRYVRGVLENWNRDGGIKIGGKANGENGNNIKQTPGEVNKFTEDDAERAGVISL